MAHHHHCHHDHDHSHAEDPAVLYSCLMSSEGRSNAAAGEADIACLYKKIDLSKVQCLNESEDGAGKTVFKPWDERFDREKCVESDVDEELLFYIPFTGSVKLKGIVLLGGEDEQHPRELKLFKNRPPLGFEELGGEPEQALQLAQGSSATLEYPTKVAKFNGVTSLLMYFPSNFGAETTKIYYIGLRGDFAQAHRHGVTIAAYEARPNPSDHKASDYSPVHDYVS